MNAIRYHSKNTVRILLSGLLIVLAVVIILFSLFYSSLHAMIEGELNVSLSEASTHAASLVNNTIEQSYQTLSSLASTAEIFKDNQSKADYLSRVAKDNGYKKLMLIDKTGRAVTSTGEVVDVSENKAVQTGLDGIKTTAVLSEETGSEVISVYPVWENGTVKGAAALYYSQKQLAEFVRLKSFGGAGYFQMIDTNGKVMLSSKEAIGEGENLFGMLSSSEQKEKLQKDIAQKNMGITRFTPSGKEAVLLCYTPVEIEGWYLASLVPLSALNTRTNAFVGYSIVIIVSVSILFVALICLVMLSQRNSRKALEQITLVDKVTGGYSRIRFEIEAERLMATDKRSEYALVFMDLRRFGLINEMYGSDKGDKVLKYVYRVIRRQLAQDELVARASADKFNILLHENQNEKIAARLDEIVAKINQFNNQKAEKNYLYFCEGVYIITPADESYIKVQDRAIVAIKHSHSSLSGTKLHSCSFFEETQKERLMQEQEIEDKMNGALQDGAFQVYLQPKVVAADGRIAGAEALVRWIDPEKGLIPPNQFLDIFERNRFIVSLDLYMFEQVAIQLAKWLHNGINPCTISVNISKCSISEPEIEKKYAAILKKYAVPFDKVEIELSESILYEDPAGLFSIVQRIHEVGIKCSLDDFGSSFSSLNMLDALEVDTLKLDKRFFDQASANKDRGERVIAGVISVAKKLNLKTVAEGVETNEQVELLKKAECDYIQGYAFYKPITPQEFERLAF